MISDLPQHVLLVEDNMDHVDLIRYGFLESNIPHEIHHVPDGEQALGYLFGRGDYADRMKYPIPRFILLDLNLPRIDGFSVLKAVKESPDLRRIPVVVLSSSDTVSDISESYGHHANSYLVKPTEFQQFTRLMKEISTYWLTWNHHSFQKP